MLKKKKIIENDEYHEMMEVTKEKKKNQVLFLLKKISSAGDNAFLALLECLKAKYRDLAEALLATLEREDEVYAKEVRKKGIARTSFKRAMHSNTERFKKVVGFDVGTKNDAGTWDKIKTKLLELRDKYTVDTLELLRTLEVKSVLTHMEEKQIREIRDLKLQYDVLFIILFSKNPQIYFPIFLQALAHMDREDANNFLEERTNATRSNYSPLTELMMPELRIDDLNHCGSGHQSASVNRGGVHLKGDYVEKKKKIIKNDEYHDMMEKTKEKKKKQVLFLLKKISSAGDNAFLALLECLKPKYRDLAEALLATLEREDEAYGKEVRIRLKWQTSENVTESHQRGSKRKNAQVDGEEGSKDDTISDGSAITQPSKKFKAAHEPSDVSDSNAASSSSSSLASTDSREPASKSDGAHSSKGPSEKGVCKCDFFRTLDQVTTPSECKRDDSFDIRHSLTVCMGDDTKLSLKDASEEYIKRYYPEAGKTHYSLPALILLEEEVFKDLVDTNAAHEHNEEEDELSKLVPYHAAKAKVFKRLKDICGINPSLLVSDYKFPDTFNKCEAYNRALAKNPQLRRERPFPELDSGAHGSFLSYPAGNKVYNIFFHIRKTSLSDNEQTVKDNVNVAICECDKDRKVFTTMCGPFLGSPAIIVAFPCFPFMSRDALNNILRCASCPQKVLTIDDLWTPDALRRFLQRNGVAELPSLTECSTIAKNVFVEINSLYICAASSIPMLRTDREVIQVSDGQMEKTMFILTPEQKRLIEEDEESSWLLLIAGGSGTGKTLVLKERAKRLAKKYPDEVVTVLNLPGGDLTVDFKDYFKGQGNISVQDGVKIKVKEDCKGIFGFLERYGKRNHVLLDEVPLTLESKRSLSLQTKMWTEISKYKADILGYYPDNIVILDVNDCKWKNYIRMISSCHKHVIIVMEDEAWQTGKYSQISQKQSIEEKRVPDSARKMFEEGLQDKLERGWKTKEQLDLLSLCKMPTIYQPLKVNYTGRMNQEVRSDPGDNSSPSNLTVIIGSPSSGKSTLLFEKIKNLAQPRRDNNFILLFLMGSALSQQMMEELIHEHVEGHVGVLDIVRVQELCPHLIIDNERIDEARRKYSNDSTIHVHVDDYHIRGKNTEEEINCWRSVLQNLQNDNSRLTLTITFKSHARAGRFISVKELETFFKENNVEVLILPESRPLPWCTSNWLLSHIFENETNTPLRQNARNLPTASRASALVEGPKPKYISLKYNCPGKHNSLLCRGSKHCMPYIGAYICFHSELTLTQLKEKSVFVLMSNVKLKDYLKSSLMGDRRSEVEGRAEDFQFFEPRKFRGCESSVILTVNVEDTWLLESISRARTMLFIIDCLPDHLQVWRTMKEVGRIDEVEIPQTAIEEKVLSKLDEIGCFLETEPNKRVNCRQCGHQFSRKDFYHHRKEAHDRKALPHDRGNKEDRHIPPSCEQCAEVLKC
ncbi:unnamed protein product [Darwinula stevensoni]|uniref:CARD domain-containing protein n=1 Tax=Darwinula stevensoni TaxID=69355 RepID=A0A7R9A305_9CRUS|nr:unnamed protein product [Darwinula stevensoni]CAG0889786.1 unnamed protein product [Darwinula stevensoni]